jgi:thymidylate synthase (FAD)
MGLFSLSYNKSMDTDITFRSDFTVELVDAMGDDDAVLAAMLISTLKDGGIAKLSETDKLGKINYLMRNRHGTPFEHNAMIFRSEAPIFVYREWHRHRIGVSINEQSGRYVELPPMFYIPPPNRPLKQIGKPGDYTYVPGTDVEYDWLRWDMQEDSGSQYARYQTRLRRGYAKEVARMTLGVNIYSQMYWTCNARSLMSFLTLRTLRDPFLVAYDDGQREAFVKDPGGAMFPSKPMWEIAACADAMEEIFKNLFPLTWKTFEQNGRVAP